MLQFCKENGLQRTAETLREETQVSLDTVPSIDHFVSDVRAGRWDTVLAAIDSADIGLPLLADLYEQVSYEMALLRFSSL